MLVDLERQTNVQTKEGEKKQLNRLYVFSLTRNTLELALMHPNKFTTKDSTLFAMHYAMSQTTTAPKRFK